MSKLSSSTTLSEVTFIERRGMGRIYRATITIEDLYNAIRKATIRYAPRYQRGLKNWAESTEDDLDVLLPIADDKAQINPRRAQEMAVKYLLGKLYTAHIAWNARHEDDSPEPDFDDEQKTLIIESTITVPDTAHRHRAYYYLVHWKRNPDEIPETVEAFGIPYSRDQILEMLDDFDPTIESVHCDVYVLSKVEEGFLYDEFNSDAKAPSTAVALALNPTKTPSRRFMSRLMERSRLFAATEVETRGNTIGSKSRKLTTNATIEAAARNMCKPTDLAAIEKDKQAWDDLIDFMGAFFEEWAHHFPAFLPGTNAEERNKMREESYALSNLMFHPLFKLAYDLWKDYSDNDEDWRLEDNWKNALAKIAGTISTNDPDTGSDVTVPVMSRSNPEWRDRIAVPRFDTNGTRTGFIVSSTRQTREAAYAYLRDRAGLGGGKEVREPVPA
ncbi:MAG: DNA sulfur modification protein DndB [Solirubrobacteraceae bacterium]